MLGSYLRYLYKSVTDDYHKYFFTYLEHDRNAQLLDAGCWDGMNTLKWAKKVGTTHLHGIELVESAVEQARKRGIEVMVADLNSKTSLKSNSYDVIVSNHVIEHLSKPHVFVQEMHRILKPGGYFVLGTPNLASWHNIFALLLGRQPYSGPTVEIAQRDASGKMKREKNQMLLKEVADKAAGESALGHIVVQTLPTLQKLLRSNGFTLEHVHASGYHPLPAPLARIAARIDPRHAHYVVIKCRKPAIKFIKSR